MRFSCKRSTRKKKNSHSELYYSIHCTQKTRVCICWYMSVCVCVQYKASSECISQALERATIIYGNLCKLLSRRWAERRHNDACGHAEWGDENDGPVFSVRIGGGDGIGGGGGHQHDNGQHQQNIHNILVHTVIHYTVHCMSICVAHIWPADRRSASRNGARLRLSLCLGFCRPHTWIYVYCTRVCVWSCSLNCHTKNTACARTQNVRFFCSPHSFV